MTWISTKTKRPCFLHELNLFPTAPICFLLTRNNVFIWMKNYTFIKTMRNLGVGINASRKVADGSFFDDGDVDHSEDCNNGNDIICGDFDGSHVMVMILMMATIAVVMMALAECNLLPTKTICDAPATSECYLQQFQTFIVIVINISTSYHHRHHKKYQHLYRQR